MRVERRGRDGVCVLGGEEEENWRAAEYELSAWEGARGVGGGSARGSVVFELPGDERTPVVD